MDQPVSFQQVGDMLDQIAEELPGDFYKDLNGGILLLPSHKQHPAYDAGPLYILGEYHQSRDMGRYIVIYYGSFARVYGHLSPEKQRKELRRILIHEFTHHLESLAGEKDLAVKDAIRIQKYKKRFG